MAQTLKTAVRTRILAAAAEAFAREGFAAARLTDIAAEAGVSTGNLYRYYPNKAALFDAVVPRAVAARLLWLIRARVRELGTLVEWRSATSPGSARAAALLDFWIERRLPVVILLAGAQGSSLAHVRPLVVRELTRMAHAYLASQPRDEGASSVPRVVLVQLFSSTVDMIVAILRSHDDEAEIRAAFQAFWRYQLAGLEALLAGR
ncbi:TetR/AcrR family transcriptional regulator [Halomonas elongata]|uniref:TetR family transcription regulator n=1 Tax=Halomonas elongata (strain ATCC 33173 / DSM 2581 / NBRC 15536 / NCIMB 2198 / 1H9) TaxID=768066 RepID=E1VAL9_HALED|nr:TetR/AcrR family transcriptional regulator [Halomonas elongata]WBF17719.1 TetR/AcrR family transcriptional regulator [Halomonas elongata]WPU46560.1 TetR/AcrR family transcriptional regulator [Halomonas elongata DSM 2581]CBV43968.1 TetR family transcription regulator [Halomonas elongata DSM 2581]